MKTISASNTYQNVSNNERGFRSVFGMGMLTTVAAGTIASPIAIFGVSMVGVYLVITAIIGSDPVYAVTEALATSTGHKDLVTA